MRLNPEKKFEASSLGKNVTRKKEPGDPRGGSLM